MLAYLIFHQGFAVLQMVPLHNRVGVELSQRRYAPAGERHKTKVKPQSCSIHLSSQHQGFCCQLNIPSFGFCPKMCGTSHISYRTLSGTDYLFLCGQCRGRIQQQPWQRPQGQSSTSSACPSG